MICVYCIENKVSGCKYVGSTTNFVKRKLSHFSHLRRGVHSNKKLQEDYDLQGKDSFIVYPLEECTHDKLSALEEQYIESFKGNTYNLYTRCYSFTEGDRAVISQKCSGENNGNYNRPHTDEEKQLCRDNRYGKNYVCKPKSVYVRKTEEEELESRNRMSEFMRNRVVSEETKRKLSEFRKGKHFDEAVIAKMKKSRQGDKNANCKLTREQVLDIHTKMNSGVSYTTICSLYSIGQTQAYKIKRGEHWVFNG